MNKAEFMEGIHILQDSYNQIFSKDKLRLWYEKLKEMSSVDYLKNINNLVKTNKYMPNVAEILDKKQTKCNYTNYKQREYGEMDFNKFYANKEDNI